MDNYNAESIKILSGIEHIRLRFGMYIGSNADTSPLFNEAIDNSIDEVTAGYSDSLTVDCVVDDKQAKYTIVDTGDDYIVFYYKDSLDELVDKRKDIFRKVADK